MPGRTAAAAANRGDRLETRLYERVAEHVASLIARGALRPGERLPSVRETSAQHGVSMATAVHAYDLLENRGLVEARPQSGHYVTAPAESTAPEPRACKPGRGAYKITTEDHVRQLIESLGDNKVLSLGAAIPSADFLPEKRLATVLARVAREASARSLAYERASGNRNLVRQIAKRAPKMGAAFHADDVVVTVGAMEALHLSLRATTRPGDTVAVESPTYFGIIQLLASLGLKVVEIPVRAKTGMDLDVLERVLAAGSIAACLATPNFNNPAGARMPDDAKERLVAMLGKRDIPLIEDDIYGDLAFAEARPMAAKAWDKRGLVLLCSSFSKTLAPGYRIGWTAPGKFRERVAELKFAQTVASPTVLQLAIASFLETGGYERHLRTLRKRLELQVRQFSAAVATHFPPGTRISRPEGGFVLWIELPQGARGLELHTLARERGISIAPGPLFAVHPNFAHFIRLSCGLAWSPEVERAIRTLGSLVDSLRAP